MSENKKSKTKDTITLTSGLTIVINLFINYCAPVEEQTRIMTVSSILAGFLAWLIMRFLLRIEPRTDEEIKDDAKFDKNFAQFKEIASDNSLDDTVRATANQQLENLIKSKS
jgi:hypothetical protein